LKISNTLGKFLITNTFNS